MPKGAGFGWPDDGDPLRRGSLALAQAEFAQDPGVGMPYPLVSDERARSRASAVPAVICSFSTGTRVPMLGWTRSVAPDSRFVVGRAEALPVAGSLHYVDLGKFFPEASRVLGAEGELVVYDFSPQVNEWFGAFMTRYPTPPFSGRILTPDLLAPLAPGFRPIGPEWYEESLPLDHSFYVDYAMTEANVAAAVRAGVDEEASRELRHATIVSVSGA